MTVSIVSLTAHGTDDVCVSFAITNGTDTQTERLVVAAATVADLHLTVGDCNEACFDAVLAAAQKHEATRRALSLLSFGRQSPKALVRKLVQKGTNRDIATEAVKGLIRRGYLNPRADAYAEATACVAKGWGKTRITSTLYEKGYAAPIVHEALDHLDDDGVDYVENCAALMRRRFPDRPTDPRERAKMYASLARYGYTSSDIREALQLLENE